MALVSDYAVSEKSLSNREYPEPESTSRTPFQRDRDRVIHSKAFRRLEYKTQVFVNHLGDNYRTRLTHSIEVSQIARSVARSLRLNEDLVETLALAHDLGHPPFGHAGERILHKLMLPYGGFDHNQQTLRIVTALEERYPEFSGLNLTQASILGLQKHNRLAMGQSHSLEAQVVDICDEIAYNNHDIDDGLASGLLNLEELNKIELWRESWEEVNQKFPKTTIKIKISVTIRSLINQMVIDLTEQSEKNIASFHIKSLDDVLNFHKNHASHEKIIHFSESISPKITKLKKFLGKHLYMHPKVKKMNANASQLIRNIFTFLIQHPKLLPEEYQSRTSDLGLHRNISDFIAGMTDRYAIVWSDQHISEA